MRSDLFCAQAYTALFSTKPHEQTRTNLRVTLCDFVDFKNANDGRTQYTIRAVIVRVSWGRPGDMDSDGGPHCCIPTKFCIVGCGAPKGGSGIIEQVGGLR